MPARLDWRDSSLTYRLNIDGVEQTVSANWALVRREEFLLQNTKYHGTNVLFYFYQTILDKSTGA